ncbi:crossover junction endodeoxyribonuclease RuvC [Paenibacillus sp. UNCCL117]|uniref:hypothetical protein n=1 Tax=unclassified Paenibacillus TaxID=185978 RepID=UPI0008924D64|nr:MULTISPECIES: hypothetical protein [unclassified Paenibacillus]SDD27763.1 crossover junction endodeoxyribonuclease RuvC [Paenibacillus sp. cl123]SFW41027.1 crossover junction endodeoxyribonuclease RuvC [Paenibacillus sp. UNCCL117]
MTAKELTGAGASTPRKIRTLHDEVLRHLQKGDNVCIEGFALDAQDTNKVSSGNNWAARLAADRIVGAFEVAAPGQLKKFVDVSEWTGVKGSKKRLPGPTVKKLVQQAVERIWGFRAPTDNIADAYVLARIAEALHAVKAGRDPATYPDYQREVLESIIDPDSAKKKGKTKKPGAAARGPAKRAQKTEQTILF